MAGLRDERPWGDLARRFDAMPVGIAVWSPDARLVHANPVQIDLFQIPAAELVGRGIEELIEPLQQASVLASIDALRVGVVNAVECVFRCRRPDRIEVRLRGHVTAVFGPGGRPVNLLSFIFDFVDVIDAQRRIERIGTHDPLTGLANRALLNDLCEAALARLRRDDGSLSLLFIDIDNFKQINDRLGHQVGDEVLRQIARRIESAIRGSDAAARLGGDEFVVLVEDHDPALALEVANRLIASIARPLEITGHHLSVGASIGIAEVGDPRTAVSDLLGRADAAMYRAKALGGGQVAVGR